MDKDTAETMKTSATSSEDREDVDARADDENTDEYHPIGYCDLSTQNTIVLFNGLIMKN